MKAIKKNKYILFTIVFILLAFFIFGLNSFHKNIWYDEAYQMVLNRYSFSDIIYFVSQDFSPPLYAITLKLVTTIFSFNDLVVARMLSFIVFSLLFVTAFFPIRRIFGEKTAFIFSILLLLVYPSFFASIETRTYSFAMTFTLIAAVYALSIVKRNKFIDYLIYVITSIFAVYSHNYAIMAIFILDNMLLFYAIFKRHDLIKKIFISNIIVLLAFAPWISVVSNQAKNLEASFWISKPNLMSIEYTFYYLFTYDVNINILLLITFIIAILFYYKKNFKKALFIILPFILTIIFFYIYSLVKAPLYIPKYTVPVCALLYLFIAIILASSKYKIIPIIFLVLLVPSFITNFKYERRLTNDKGTEEMIETVNNYTKNKDFAFFESTEFGLGISEYFFKGKTHYIDKDVPIYVTTTDIFGDVKTTKYKNDIKENLLVCFYLDNFRLQKLEEMGYKVILKREFYVQYDGDMNITILKKEI